MSTGAKICPVCDEGALRTDTYNDELTLRSGLTINVMGLRRSLCDVCGADPVLPDQFKHNQALIADAKREAQGLLTSKEILAIRKRLGLSQKQASIVFGGGVNAFSKYERGEVIQSDAMDKLLRVADYCKQDVLSALGVPASDKSRRNEISSLEYGMSRIRISTRRDSAHKSYGIPVNSAEFRETSIGNGWIVNNNKAA